MGKRHDESHGVANHSVIADHLAAVARSALELTVPLFGSVGSSAWHGREKKWGMALGGGAGKRLQNLGRSV